MAFVYLIFIGDNLQTFLKWLGKCDLYFSTIRVKSYGKKELVNKSMLPISKLNQYNWCLLSKGQVSLEGIPLICLLSREREFNGTKNLWLFTGNLEIYPRISSHRKGLN